MSLAPVVDVESGQPAVRPPDPPLPKQSHDQPGGRGGAVRHPRAPSTARANRAGVGNGASPVNLPRVEGEEEARQRYSKCHPHPEGVACPQAQAAAQDGKREGNASGEFWARD